MPLYEYQCEPCDHTFETLIRSNSEVATLSKMRECQGRQAVERSGGGSDRPWPRWPLPISGAPEFWLRSAPVWSGNVRWI